MKRSPGFYDKETGEKVVETYIAKDSAGGWIVCFGSNGPMIHGDTILARFSTTWAASDWLKEHGLRMATIVFPSKVGQVTLIEVCK